jgi:hypothetical protein
MTLSETTAAILDLLSRQGTWANVGVQTMSGPSITSRALAQAVVG